MISNLVLQNSIDEVRAITKIDLAVLDLSGAAAASTFEAETIPENAAEAFAVSPAESQTLQGYLFFKIPGENEPEYILVIKGTGEDIYMLGRLVVSQLHALILAYKERYDRSNFIQNLLLDNLLMVDIFNQAKKLHIEQEAARVVYLVETEAETNPAALTVLKALFADSSRDYVVSVDEKSVVVLREMNGADGASQLRTAAEMITEALHAGGIFGARVSYGTPEALLKDVSRSYKEAKMAMDVGRIFYADQSIIAYSTLGIGRLIYQLPLPLCQMFMREVFGKNTPDTFDEETLITVYKFFENSLNVSETARQLYIHRNTLVYRLEKLQKLTGLDIRVFEDALTFQIALMVAEYMKYLESMC